MRNLAMGSAVVVLWAATWFAAGASGQALKGGTYWIVYDVHTPKKFKLCDHKVFNSADMNQCPDWHPLINDPPEQVFRSGTLIKLEVLNGKFKSVFSLDTTGVVVQEAGPEIRGVPEATTQKPAATTAQPGGKPTPEPAEKPEIKSNINQFEDQYDKTAMAIADAEDELNTYFQKYVGPAPPNDVGDCSPRVMRLPPARVYDMLYFANQLMDDANACNPDTDPYFRNEQAFYSLTDRADRLVQTVSIFNASLAPLPSLADAKAAWANYLALVQKVPVESVPQLQSYLAGGSNYNELQRRMQALEDREKLVNHELGKLNVSMTKAFSLINALYSISASPQPFLLPVTQKTTSFSGNIQISEATNVVLYTVTAAKTPATNTQVNPQQLNSQPVNSQPTNTPLNMPPPPGIAPAPRPPTPNPAVGSYEEQNEAPTLTPASYSIVSGVGAIATPPSPDKVKPAPQDKPLSSNTAAKYVDTTDFEVHKMYRANLVAGFFASSLKNFPYGLTNNGQASSTQNLTFVAVAGQPYSPQFHAYVGIDIYIWERDSFPGEASKQNFLWFRKHNRFLNGYFNPNIMIGYGVDSLNNYLVGPNWELPWGINVGAGLHIGQETKLLPGIVPGMTQLPSSATSPPTYNKTAYGYYGNLGFDLGVMKTAISNLFGK